MAAAVLDARLERLRADILTRIFETLYGMQLSREEQLAVASWRPPAGTRTH
jgi:hypothetical protein